MRLQLLFIVSLATLGCSNKTDEAIIRTAETQLVLPQKAAPLTEYHRYYAITGETAKGIFIWSEFGRGDFTFVATEDDLPFVADGGCGVIQVRFSLTKKSWDSPFCHGP